MNSIEKLLMVFLVITVIFFLAPLVAEAYGIWFIAIHFMEYGLVTLLGLTAITAASLAAGVSFIVVIRTFYCARCVNFSCPLNTVPESVINDYLKNNQIMREAWEKSGWSIKNG